MKIIVILLVFFLGSSFSLNFVLKFDAKEKKLFFDKNDTCRDIVYYFLGLFFK